MFAQPIKTIEISRNRKAFADVFIICFFSMLYCVHGIHCLVKFHVPGITLYFSKMLGDLNWGNNFIFKLYLNDDIYTLS